MVIWLNAQRALLNARLIRYVDAEMWQCTGVVTLDRFVHIRPSNAQIALVACFTFAEVAEYALDHWIILVGSIRGGRTL
jgi:hypothetical protein